MGEVMVQFRCHCSGAGRGFKVLDMIHDVIGVFEAGEQSCYTNLNGVASPFFWYNMACGWQSQALLKHLKYCSLLQGEFMAEFAAWAGLLSVALDCSYAMVRLFQHTLYCSSSSVACVVWQCSQHRCSFVQHLPWRQILGQEVKKRVPGQYET